MNGPAAAELEKDLAAAGFLCLGGFSPGKDSDVPALSGGTRPQTLLLIGSTGPSIWPCLVESPEWADGADDPLDRYTARVLGVLARKHACEPLFPFQGPPYHPFQKWAQACGGFSQSPMGVLAHQVFGPWAGFRAVFLSSQPLDTPPAAERSGPCDTCLDKPCIAACPANALSLTGGYDVPRCRDHLARSRALDCWSGCLARRACPVGTPHRQDPATARFHMDSFIGL
ncbi:hypothetical protein [Labrenzia sp. 011]|uniref:hypothetical protein n=1 Tax=Labrenzia sp. 011 TaxID=2171494 RepID=UPI000D52434E|nr:hypothetical protein [Labrenzia sp. 011]PVB61463.1 hypothetical protein DCO57_11485 [Labrenzia sp. 011]